MCHADHKKGRTKRVEEIELPSQENIRTLEKITSLGILEADIITQAEIKEKIRKEYLKRTKKTSQNQASAAEISSKG